MSDVLHVQRDVGSTLCGLTRGNALVLPPRRAALVTCKRCARVLGVKL